MARRADREATRRLLQLADRAEPAVRLALHRALAQLQAALPARRLERVLRSGDQAALEALLRALPARLRPATRLLARELAQAYALERARLASVTVRGRLDLVDPDVAREARDHAAALVTQVTDQTRQAIRAVMGRSVVEGIPPREAATLLRPLVGLTRRQALAVVRLRRELLREGRDQDGLARRLAAYAARLLRQRTVLIARTETIAAATRGQLLAWARARREGLLPATAKIIWETTPDDRRCPYCASMHGTQVRLGTSFITPLGARRGPPMHPNCRCALGVLAVPQSNERIAA